MQHRFKLEPHPAGKRTKYQCPACNYRNKFTRYIDTETGKALADHVGRCDRKDSCGYHLPPKDYLSTAGISLPPAKTAAKQPEPVRPASYHEPELLTKYGSKYTNGLTEYLLETFGKEATNRLIDRYRIGTYSQFTVFWQIDLAGRLRAGKLIQYDASRGKRTGGGNWLHTKLKLEAFTLKQCLYGEHLLHDRQLPVAIVESEKTAIIASHLVPDMLWLAAGGIDGLKAEKLKVLKGRTVVLYPDLGAFEKWQAIGKELSYLASFTVSDLLEQEASDEDRAQGLDIADLLLRELPLYGVEESMTPPLPQEQSSSPAEPTWQERLEDLRGFYASVSIQGVELRVNEYHVLADAGQWVPAYFDAVQQSRDEAERNKYLLRLEQLRAAIPL